MPVFILLLLSCWSFCWSSSATLDIIARKGYKCVSLSFCANVLVMKDAFIITSWLMMVLLPLLLLLLCCQGRLCVVSVHQSIFDSQQTQKSESSASSPVIPEPSCSVCLSVTQSFICKSNIRMRRWLHCHVHMNLGTHFYPDNFSEKTCNKHRASVWYSLSCLFCQE